MIKPDSVTCPMCGRPVPAAQIRECDELQFQAFCRHRGAKTPTDHVHGYCRNEQHLRDRCAQGEFIHLETGASVA